MRLSVIIPTFNRLPVLLRALDLLWAQQGQPDMEILVVDDGSTDGTAEALAGLSVPRPHALHVLKQENRGPAAARNLGLQEACGELVLFLGDDIFAQPGLVATHLEAHARHPEDPVAVLGHTAFSPDMRRTSLSHYVESSGLQFAYRLIKDPASAPYECFYTSNISLKRRYLLQNGLFDEDFPYAAYEDIELGYRLHSGHALRIVYEPNARAYHYHPVSLQQLRSRGVTKGRSMVIYGRKHPEALDLDQVLRLFPAYKNAIKRAIFALLTPLAELAERTGWILPLGRYYAWLDAYWCYRGMLEGLALEAQRRGSDLPLGADRGGGGRV